MNKWLEILVGLILIVGTIYAVWGLPAMLAWKTAALSVLMGSVVWLVLLIGLLLLLLGLSDLKG